MANLDIGVKPVPGDSSTAIVELAGVIDGGTVGALNDAIEGLVGRGVTRVIVDMNKVRYVNSTGLQALVAAGDRLGSSGGGLALIRVTAKVRIVIEMLGLQSEFRMCADEAEAMAKVPVGGDVGGGAPPPPAPNPYGQQPPSPYGQSPQPSNPYGQPPPAPSPYGQQPPSPYGQPAPRSPVPAPPKPPSSPQVPAPLASPMPAPPGAPPGGSPWNLSPRDFSPPPQAPAAPPPEPEAPAATGATTVACEGCGIDLELPQPGAFKCPRCRALVTRRPDGGVTFQKPQGRPPFELQITCTQEGAAGLMHFVGAVTHGVLQSPQKVEGLQTAVGEVAQAIASAAYNWSPDGIVHVEVETREKEVRLQFADLGATIDAAQIPTFFANTTRIVSDFECRPHPKRGNVIRFVMRA